MLFHLTAVSQNMKTGPMPVSTSSAKTCPDACPLKGGIGCYAMNGPMRNHWKAVTGGDRGLHWPEFLKKVENLPRGQLWRHNQAGDLPGENNIIDTEMLEELVAASRKASAHGFTYTHKPMTPKNAAAVKKANEGGFTINLSADTVFEADELMATGAGPVVVILPHDAPESSETPAGHKVIVCPAQSRDRMNCMNCQLCSDAKRTSIIGFRAHGSGSKITESAVAALEKKEAA